MAIDVRDLATRPLEPIIAEELDIFERTVAEYLDGRVDEDIVPRLPPEPRRLRPAPGRPQPDAAHQDPARPHHRRAARDVRLHRRDLLARAGVTSPPARTCSSTSSSSSSRPRSCACMASVGLTSREACGDTVRNVMGCHLAGACPQEMLDITPWAEGDHRLPAPPPVRASACPASSRSTSRAARPTAARRCSTTSASSRPPARSPTARRSRLPGVRRRRSRRQPAPGAGARGLHRPRRPAADDRRVPAHVRPLRQPRQQDPRPHEVARRHDGHRRAARAHLPGAQVPARRARLAGGHPRAGPRAGRRAGGRRLRAPKVEHQGRPGEAALERSVRPLGRGQRRARRRQAARSA